MNEKPSVLLVEDDPLISASLTSQFEADGFEVRQAHNGTDGAAAFAASKPDAVVTDIAMEGGTGIDMLETISKTFPNHGVPIFVLTNTDNMDNVANALRNDVVAYIMKSDKTVASISGMVKTKLKL